MNEIAAKLIETHEGRRNHPYKCTAGKLTIGIGHNLDDVPISDEAIDVIFKADLEAAERVAAKYPYFEELDIARQAALIDMSFQLGAGGLAEFRKMHKALEAGDFDTAHFECLNSDYATQTPARAHRIANILKTGAV